MLTVFPNTKFRSKHHTKYKNKSIRLQRKEKEKYTPTGNCINTRVRQ